MADSSFHPIEMRSTERFAFDMRHLLDAPAGKHGLMRAAEDGHFYFADGTRARFWGTNLAHDRAVFIPHDAMDRVADHLASIGCNMIRFHALDWPRTGPADDGAAGPIFDDLHYQDTRHLSEANLEKLDYAIHALSQRGIYLYMDLLDYRQFTPADGVVDAEGLNWAAKPACVYDPTLIELQKEYATNLLTRTNTHTGLRYVDDPAICCVEITNETSLFWEQALHLPKYYVDELQALWNAWLLETYRGRTGLEQAWTNGEGRGALLADEDPEAGTVRLPNVVDAFRLSWAHRSYGDPLEGTVRCNDGARFYYDLQRRYYRTMRDHLRAIGVKVPITACVTPHIAPDLKAVADELDFISNGTYYDHPNYNVRLGPEERLWGMGANTVELNNLYGTVAHVALGKVAGKPMIAREWNMPFPNEYRSEAMLQMAAYACLQDWDGMLHYGIGGSVLRDSNDLAPFSCYNDPEHWSQFPIAALMFHRRDVQSAQHVLDVGYSDTDTFYAWRSHEEVPSRYGAYLLRTQKTYFDGTYDGPGDMVISSGASSQGDYQRARRAFLWAENPAADLYDKVRDRAAIAEGLAPSARTALSLVPELHLPHGFGARLMTVEGIGYDRLAMFATRDPAFEVASLPEGARPVGSDGVWCLGYFDGQRLVVPHLTALEARMRDPQQMTLARFLVDALSALGLEPDLSRRDVAGGTLRSATGELVRELRRGRFFVDTPCTQAAVGFVGGETVAVGDLRIELTNQHAVVALSSLDGLAIPASRSLLLTVIGRARNTEQERDGMAVYSGHEPVLYEPAAGRVTLRLEAGGGTPQVTRHDPAGRRLEGDAHTEWANGELTISLSTDAPITYYHVTRT